MGSNGLSSIQSPLQSEHFTIPLVSLKYERDVCFPYSCFVHIHSYEAGKTHLPKNIFLLKSLSSTIIFFSTHVAN